MKLTILGGAAACPNPGQGSSSYLIQVSEQNWLLDCGPDTMLELRKHVELDQIDRVLISHFHADHTLDLVPMRYGLKYAPGLSPHRPVLEMPPNGTQFLARVAAAFAMGSEGPDNFFQEVFDVREYNPERGLTSGDLSVTFLKTNHPVPCWAMRIDSSSGSLAYLADSGPLDDLVAFATGADILICEGTFPDHGSVRQNDSRPHLSALEAGMIARDAGVTQFVLTHLWASAGLDDYLEAAAQGFGREATLALPGVQLVTS